MVVTPPTLGVGLLEFHQFDRMVLAGRLAARALLEAMATDIDHAGVWPAREVQLPAQVALPDVRETLSPSP